MFTYRTKSIGILTISGIIDRIRHIYISDLFLFKLLPFKRRKCLKQSTLGADMLKSLGNCLHLRRKRLSNSTFEAHFLLDASLTIFLFPYFHVHLWIFLF